MSKAFRPYPRYCALIPSSPNVIRFFPAERFFPKGIRSEYGRDGLFQVSFILLYTATLRSVHPRAGLRVAVIF